MKHLAQVRRRRWWTTGLLLVSALLVAVELGVRVLGLIDFPLYDADARIGYIPSASQHGSFMRRNDWQINDRHMAGGSFQPSPNGNLLLIGDSIVWGGNPYAASERLGAQLQTQLRARVWAVAAGSWGLQNELTYLNENPDVVSKVDQIVFISNSGDFDKPSSWTCETSHPRQYPLSAFVFLLKKHFLKTECPSSPLPEFKVPDANPLDMLQQFAHAHPGKPLKFVLYPDQSECSDAALRRERLEKYKPMLLSAGATEVYSLGDWQGWQACQSIYKDGIHPVPHAYGVLARFLSDRVARGT
jgi:hypothetical protein